MFPLATSIALCSLGATVSWFVDDFWADCLENIKRLGRLAGLRQDHAVLDSPLSAIELGRIQRALCRFATLACLLKALEDSDRRSYWKLGHRFLTPFREDEVEEIRCIRDYLMRRLWGVFETIEDDAMQFDESSPLWRMARAVPGCWFSASLKRSHPIYMDHMTNLGLPFLREVLESRGLKRADLVMRITHSRAGGITSILHSSDRSFADPFDDGEYYGTADFEGDSLVDISSGWLYANRRKLAEEHNRTSRKGFRDWAYVMLDRERLAATGVLEKESDTPT
ncbi:MAG: hypothetical protein LQ348_006915 [Seirophora lacunosa]|nr:MAG: hypothetical protein LQ348_006915 [Seirophora lacunosa]